MLAKGIKDSFSIYSIFGEEKKCLIFSSALIQRLTNDKFQEVRPQRIFYSKYYFNI
jgi:hypothetical protein